MLDSRHSAVRSFFEHLHATHCHQNVKYLRALILQNFAILKLRTTLRTLQTRCLTCRKCKAETLSPIMADLQKERLAFASRPFTNTGLDYFGPFYVSVKRSTEKRWEFLFTCLATPSISKLSHQWAPASVSCELRDSSPVRASHPLSGQTIERILLQQRINYSRLFSSGITNQLPSPW